MLSNNAHIAVQYTCVMLATIFSLTGVFCFFFELHPLTLATCSYVLTLCFSHRRKVWIKKVLEVHTDLVEAHPKEGLEECL